MIGRRIAVVLSLICAQAFCALAAQGASASGTTAFTCSSGAAIKGFSDEHCDTAVGTSEGSFGHVGIEAGQETEVEYTNGKTKNETKEATPAIFKGVIAGVAFEISCTTVSGSAKDTNKEISGAMQNEGTGLALKYSGCAVSKPTKGCKVKETLEMAGSTITKENLGSGSSEMGVEFKPTTGKAFTEFTFEGTECVLKGKSVTVEGAAVATGSRGSTAAVTSSGATLVFTTAMTKETLKAAGNAAELSSTVTVKMKGEGGKPVTLTTTASEATAECGEWVWPEEDCELWESPKPAEEELKKELEKGFEWPPEEKLAKAEEEEKDDHDPILFVHGWLGSASSFKTMVGRFEAAGWDKDRLFNWVYDWTVSNVTTAESIKTSVETILKLTHSKEVDIVTHSMGALSSRYYIKELGGATKVKHWVSLAGPNHGTALAEACADVSCQQMRPGSAFLKNLNAVETPAGPKYATWRAGTAIFDIPCDWVILPPSSVELGGTSINHMTECMGHSALHEEAAVFEEVRKFVES